MAVTAPSRASHGSASAAAAATALRTTGFGVLAPPLLLPARAARPASLSPTADSEASEKAIQDELFWRFLLIPAGSLGAPLAIFYLVSGMSPGSLSGVL